MEEWSRRAFWIVIAVAGVLLILRMGSFPLLDPDESRFARTSVEMARSGDLVVPTFEGVPRLVKPPLLHWFQAALFRAFGVSEGTARIPAALATLGSVLLLGWVARRRFGDEGAAWAAAFFIVMPLVMTMGRVGTLDALLSVHILAALALDLAGPPQTRPFRGGALGALLGLVFLIKGPVGVLLTLFVMLAGRTASGREVMPGLRQTLAVCGAFLFVVLPWGLAFLERVGPAKVMETVRTEVFSRAFEGTAHIEPPWFFAKVVAIGFLPWVGPLIVGAFRSMARMGDPEARTARYAAAGLFAGLLFFSLSKGKLPNYILPLAPLATLLITWEFGQELAEPGERRLGPRLVAATLVALAFVLGVAPFLGLGPEVTGMAFAGAIEFGLAAVVALLALARPHPRLVYGAAAVAAALFHLSALVVLLPLLGREHSAESLVREMPVLTSKRPVLLVEKGIPSLTFYADRIPEHLSITSLPERLDALDAPLVVIDEDDLGRIPPSVRSRIQAVGHSGRYHVYEGDGAQHRKQGE